MRPQNLVHATHAINNKTKITVLTTLESFTPQSLVGLSTPYKTQLDPEVSGIDGSAFRRRVKTTWVPQMTVQFAL